MKIIKGQFFEVSVSAERMQEDGQYKRVTEVLCVDAMSFTEAEAKTLKEMETSAIIKNINPAPYKEVCVKEPAPSEPRYYKAKISYMAESSTGKEKKCSETYLVQAEDFDDANESLLELMDGMMGECLKSSINETKIVQLV